MPGPHWKGRAGRGTLATHDGHIRRCRRQPSNGQDESDGSEANPESHAKPHAAGARKSIQENRFKRPETPLGSFLRLGGRKTPHEIEDAAMAVCGAVERH